MKKLVLIASVTFLTISFFSCKKNKSINKTSWTYQTPGEKDEIKFLTNTDMTLTIATDTQTVSYGGTYTYNSPNLTIALLGSAIVGIVKGSNLTITNPNGSIFVFTKE